MPIEQLAQLLLECARQDAALPRRAPANDDDEHARYVDEMYNRLEALPELRRETSEILPRQQVSIGPGAAAEVASNEDLEELVAIALSSAQEAEDISREANVASRKATRGMFAAVGLAVIGIAIAGAATVGARYEVSGNQQMAEIGRQVQTLDALQHRINDQLAQMRTPRAVQDADPVQSQPAVGPSQNGGRSVAPPRLVDPSAVRPVPSAPEASQTSILAAGQPLQDTTGPAAEQQPSGTEGLTGVQPSGGAARAAAVSHSQGSEGLAAAQPFRDAALPATDQTARGTAGPASGQAPQYAAGVAATQSTRDTASRAVTQPARQTQRHVSNPPPLRAPPQRATYASAASPPIDTWRGDRTWTPYRPAVRPYRQPVVLPRPIAFILSSIQRDVRILFH